MVTFCGAKKSHRLFYGSQIEPYIYIWRHVEQRLISGVSAWLRYSKNVVDLLVRFVLYIQNGTTRVANGVSY